MPYQHVLLAIDLHPDCDPNLEKKAAEIVKRYESKFSLVHAVEHLNTYGAGFAYPAVADIEMEMFEEARKELTERASKLSVSEADAHLEAGAPGNVILDIAKKVGADLIIVGSHGRHGLQLLLGSTANAVLHHAECDVLAVRVKEHD